MSSYFEKKTKIIFLSRLFKHKTCSICSFKTIYLRTNTVMHISVRCMPILQYIFSPTGVKRYNDISSHILIYSCAKHGTLPRNFINNHTIVIIGSTNYNTSNYEKLNIFFANTQKNIIQMHHGVHQSTTENAYNERKAEMHFTKHMFLRWCHLDIVTRVIISIQHCKMCVLCMYVFI